jgi:tetratricopeptide (TPR) repeat protein
MSLQAQVAKQSPVIRRLPPLKHTMSSLSLLAVTYEIMDTSNPVIKLCIQGTRAEFEHRLADAHTLYKKAWDVHVDDYEACIAAHYLARFQDGAEETLFWNQVALKHADADNDERVKEFYPSLYLNLGRSYEILGNQREAQRYYGLAAELGVAHQPD